MKLIPVTLDQIPLGQPLPWPLYDKEGNVMFYDGEEISAQQVQLLSSVLEDGLFRQGGEAAAAPEGEKEAPKPKTKAKPAATEKPDIAMGELFPPPGIRPQVGERLQLRLLNSGANYVSRLVGYIKGHSIIVTTPAEQGQLIEFIDGEQVEVRMLTGSEITLFRTAILRSCISPTHYLHLEYPAKVSRQKLRQSPWVKVDIGTDVVGAAGAQTRGRIINLSGNGAKVVTTGSVGAERDTIHLTFPVNIDDIRTDLSLDAVIRRTATSAGTKGRKIVEYGVEFSHIPPEQVLWLRCLVFERIAKGHLA